RAICWSCSTPHHSYCSYQSLLHPGSHWPPRPVVKVNLRAERFCAMSLSDWMSNSCFVPRWARRSGVVPVIRNSAKKLEALLRRASIENRCNRVVSEGGRADLRSGRLGVRACRLVLGTARFYAGRQKKGSTISIAEPYLKEAGRLEFAKP